MDLRSEEDDLATIRRFAAGEIDRHEVEDKTGLHFGEILLLMRERGIARRRVGTYESMSGSERALFDEIFSP